MGRKLTQDEVILKLRNIYKDSLNFENFKYINNTVKSEVICPTHGMFTATSLTLYNKFGCSKCKFEELKNKYYNYCKKLHNDKYEYYNDYIKKHDIIKIKCPIHGDFSQEANHHYMGHGCSKCSGSYMRTFEEFVKDFNKIHLNKYNYEKNYSIKNKNKINIICPYHGLFSQYVNHHLRGSGCPKCVGRNLNTLEIINNFKKIHGDKFDYSKVKYETTKIKVKIICKEHGIFKQIPTSHLQGSGCPRCFEERRRLILLKSPENFIKDCVRVHGNRYDYSKTDYISSYKEVKIICRQHGLFLQKPSNHLSGSNCPLCKSIFLSECHRDNIEKIILEFKKTHGNKYSYNKVNYVNSKSKVEIICHKHGSFLQSREVHSKGNGCPKCGKIVSKPEMELADFIKSLNYEILTSKRNIIKPYELDIYIPSLKKAIEFNGIYWHYNHTNPNCKPKGYHAMKSNLCKEQGIKLLHIREDLWSRDKNHMKEVILKFLEEYLHTSK